MEGDRRPGGTEDELTPEREAEIKRAIQPPVTNSGDSTKVCPDCAETVLADARVCRYCGHRFQMRSRTGYVIAIAAVAIVALIAVWFSGVADPVLARWDLNKGDCLEDFDGKYLCGDSYDRQRDFCAQWQSQSPYDHYGCNLKFGAWADDGSLGGSNPISGN